MTEEAVAVYGGASMIALLFGLIFISLHQRYCHYLVIIADYSEINSSAMFTLVELYNLNILPPHYTH